VNVPADALYELATVSGAPTTYRAEGVVRWAADKLRDKPKPYEHVQQLREAAEYALRYLTDPKVDDHNGAVERLRQALGGTT
jgi:hypothetical protein